MESVSGRVFGVLPLVFSPYTLPPLPIAYISLTGVEATGVWMTAGRVTAPQGTLGTARLRAGPVRRIVVRWQPRRRGGAFLPSQRRATTTAWPGGPRLPRPTTVVSAVGAGQAAAPGRDLGWP
ncbi:hypothetical protein ACWGCW_22720 [Streptomyces sp. NPDC054933]